MVEVTNDDIIKIPNLYSKRTVAQKTTPITVPPKFKLDEKVEYPGGYHDSSLYLFYILTMAVEGNDGVNSKLVIKHYPTKTDACDIVVPLRGYWDEYEKPDLEHQFNNNFLAGVQYTEEQEKKLLEKKGGLIAYLYDYFHNNVVGKGIMEYVRKRSEIQQQKLDAADAAHYDKVVRETAEHIMAKYHIATIWETGDMLYFKDGRHVMGAERIIDEEAFALFQYDARTYMIEEVKKAIRRQTYHELSEFEADKNIINIKNGLWHIEEKTLTEHTPDYLSLKQKDVTYIPGAKATRWDQFLNEVVYPSQVKTLKQCAAYTFYRDTPHETYVILVGFGNNGKTKVTNVLTRLHGEDSVSHVPLNDISKDQFALVGLEGKDLNIDNEPSGGVIKNSAILKKLTGQERIRVREIYTKAHDVKLHAKLWTSTNDIPDIPDQSIGRFRREIAIMFPYTFKENPDPSNPMEKLEDPDIEEKLTTDEELSGIFNMLMDELHDILYKQKKRVYIDMQDIEARKKHREMLKNPMKFFVDEVLDIPYSMYDDSVRKDDLFKIYEQFCRVNSLPPIGKQEFGSSLVRTVGRDKISDGREKDKDPVTKKRPTTWRGIKVKPEWLDEDKRLIQTSLLGKPLEEDEEEENEQEQQTDNQQKPLSDLSDLSGLNGQNNLSVQENDVQYDPNPRSNIASDTPPSPVLDLKKPENVTSSLTSPDRDDKLRIIFDMIHKSMGDKGYFTKDDFIYTSQMAVPNLHWTEDDAEQTLYQLLEEGTITEIEPGKYKLMGEEEI